MIATTPIIYEIPQSVRNRLRPAPRLTVSEWCDEHRHLDPKFCAEPGRWKTSRVPYLREIMDSFSDPAVGSIIFIKCARVGGTEFLNNILAYSADARPMPTMYVLPKEPDVADEFAGRLKGLFECSPTLRNHIRPGQWVSSNALHLDTMTIYGGWASAPDTLIRKTCGTVIFDEVDNCQKHAGRLGNTWDLAGKRLVTFGYRGKLIGTTTPTTEDATGWTLYQASDKRQFYVPCPDCGGYQVLKFASIKWPEGKDADQVELDALAGYACGHCGVVIDEKHQRWMVERGLWVPACQRIEQKYPMGDAPANWKPELIGQPPRTRNRGYHINSLYSPWMSWSKIAAAFLRAKGDPEKLRVFVNQVLGEPWHEEKEEVKEDWLHAKAAAAKYPAGVVPAEARVLFVTADVQKDYIFYCARAWGPELKSWRVEVGKLPNLDDLYELATVRGWPLSHDPSSRMTAYLIAVDGRYRKDEVLRFSLKPGVVALWGYEERNKFVERSNIAPKNTDPKWVWNVSTKDFKNRLIRLMQAPLNGPGAWALHENPSQDDFKHLTAEHYVSVKTSGGHKCTWRKKSVGLRNEGWDVEVYQLVVVQILEQERELMVINMTQDSPRERVIGPPPTSPPKTRLATAPAPRVTGGFGMGR